MSALQAAGLWTALLILLLIGLSLRVMIARRTHRVSLGDGKDRQLAALSRGFGNAAEYTPLMIGALILLAQLGASPFEIHLLGGSFLAGRVVHPLGLALDRATPARVIGMTLTWVPLLGAVVLLLIAVFALG
jgi:uncharacterized membrane protein YecN with MAPEG domain